MNHLLETLAGANAIITICYTIERVLNYRKERLDWKKLENALDEIASRGPQG